MTSGTIACGELRIPRTALLERAARVSAGLRTLHVEGGDRVVILSHNRTEFLEISLGTGRVGAYAVPINWHLKRGEIDVLLDDCQPELMFIEASLLAEVPAEWLDRVTTIVLDETRGAPRDYASWRDSFEPSTLPASRAPGSMMYTSGTTGRPKGVERSPATLEQQRELNAVRAALYNMDTNSRVVVPGPLYHGLPNQIAMYAALEAELLMICERFDAEDLLAMIERERITTIAVAPIMFVRLLRLPEAVRRRYDLSSLNWALHAGGPCPPEVKRAMIQWWGPVITEYYGGTETGPLTLCESAEWLSHPGTCGRPLPQARIRIVDPDGKDVPRGQPGEVFGRLLPNPDFTYRNDPQKRVDVSLGDLVSLGDVGYQDDEGYLYLCDRARDMIVSGGVNIYPAEVEAVLLSLPGVEDCAIIGVPDPEFGESVVGFASGAGLDAAKLRTQIRERIAGFKAPREIFVLPSLGRDVSGKLKKAQLRSLYDELIHRLGSSAL